MRLTILVPALLLLGAAHAQAQRSGGRSRGPKVYVITPDGHGVEESQLRKARPKPAARQPAAKKGRPARTAGDRAAGDRTARAHQAARAPQPAPRGRIEAPPAGITSEIHLVPPPARRP